MASVQSKPCFVQVLPRAYVVQSVLNGVWLPSKLPVLVAGNSKLISICDTSDVETDLPYAAYSGGCWADMPDARDGLLSLGISSVLSLAFTDSTPEFHDESSILFTAAQAHSILDFVLADCSDAPVYVHCAAGISRSGAVGLFLCRYFNLDAVDFDRLNPHIKPNPYVLHILMQESGLRESYQDDLAQVFS